MNACRIPVQIQLDNIFVSLGYAAEMPLVGYRKSHWGDSMSDVVATEGKPLVTKDGTLGYRVKLDGHEAFAAYTFIQGMLVKGSYIFTDEHSNNNAFVDDYNAISANLTVKYGKPYSHDAEWSSELFKNDPSQWGPAVEVGHATSSESWDKGEDWKRVVEGKGGEG